MPVSHVIAGTAILDEWIVTNRFRCTCTPDGDIFDMAKRLEEKKNKRENLLITTKFI